MLGEGIKVLFYDQMARDAAYVGRLAVLFMGIRISIMQVSKTRQSTFTSNITFC